MSYVDLNLNPIRAGLAADLSSSPHTSVQRRLSEPTVTSQAPPHPVAGATRAPQMLVTLNEYLTLTDWTGRARRPDKRGAIAAVPAAIARLGLSSDQWHSQMAGIETHYWRAVGAVEAVMKKARAMGQCWLKGLGCGIGRAAIRVR